MKGILLIPCIALAVLLSACSNTKPKTEFSDGTVVTVKQVATICAELILNIEDSQNKGLGEKFSFDGKAYDAAFRSYMPCLKDNTVPEFEGADEGKSFKVKLYKNRPAGGECMACMATFSKTPTITYYILPEN